MAYDPSVRVEDLQQGLNEWRNIQDVVRLTFKAFHDALRAQGDAIRWLESALEGKADSEDVWLALQEKASNTALNSKSRELVNALTHKADKEETHGCVTSDDLHSQLRHKADRADTDASIAELRNWASSARERLASLEESVHSLSESKESIRSTVAHIDSSMHSMHDTIKNAEASVEAIKGDLSGLHDSKRELGNAINTERQSRQSHTNELSEEIASIRSWARENWRAIEGLQHQQQSHRSHESSEASSLRQQLQRYIDDVKGEVDHANSAVETCKDRLSRQESALHEVQCKTYRKAEAQDVDEMKRQLDSLGSRQSHPQEDMQALKRRLERMESAGVTADDLKAKADVNDLSTLAEQIRVKADMRDVSTLLDAKAGVEEVNEALKQVSEELQKKASGDDVSKLQQRLQAIPTGASGESSVGRWIWKSGKTKAGGVPWNAEAINTDPSNFLYEKDKPTIQSVTPGLYEVNFGVFTAKRPQVQLLVNGEPVLSAVNSSTYVVHHSSGRLASTALHSAGNVTGLSLIDFLSLPSNAKIALTFKGEESGTGFLCLKKL